MLPTLLGTQEGPVGNVLDPISRKQSVSWWKSLSTEMGEAQATTHSFSFFLYR